MSVSIQQLEGRWLTSGEAARSLGISPVWLRTLVRTGRLAAVETPLGLLLAVGDVEALRRERARS